MVTIWIAGSKHGAKTLTVFASLRVAVTAHTFRRLFKDCRVIYRLQLHMYTKDIATKRIYAAGSHNYYWVSIDNFIHI